MKTIKIFINNDNRIYARVSGKYIYRIKSLNINIQKDGLNTFEIVTDKEKLEGLIVGKSGMIYGTIKEGEDHE